MKHNPVPASASERERRLHEVRREKRRLEGFLVREQRRVIAPFGEAKAFRKHALRVRDAEERLALLRSEERALAGQPFLRQRQDNPLLALWTAYMISQAGE